MSDGVLNAHATPDAAVTTVGLTVVGGGAGADGAEPAGVRAQQPVQVRVPSPSRAQYSANMDY